MPSKDEKFDSVTIDSENDNDNNNNNHNDNGVRGRNQYEKLDLKKLKTWLFWCVFTIFFIGLILCIASFSVESLKKKSLGGLFMWQWCLLITAIFGGPVLSVAINKLALLMADKALRSDVVYYTVSLVASAWAVLWFGVILLAWTWVVDKPPHYLRVTKQKDEKLLMDLFVKEKSFVTKTLIAIILGSFLWLVKLLLMMIGKSHFHILRFFERIKGTLKHEYWISTLVQQQNNNNKKVLKFTLNDVCGKPGEKNINLTDLENVNEEEVSTWTMKILVYAFINGRLLEYINNYGQKKPIENEKDAEYAADIMFKNVADNSDKIDVPKLQEVLVEQHYFNNNKEAEEVVQWLAEGVDHQNLCKDDFRKCMVRTWVNRRDLIRALQSNKNLFLRLSRSVNVILVIVVLIVWLVLLKIEIREAIVFVGGFIVSCAFFIGDLFKGMVSGFTFVFVVHPFDVGDQCLIENTLVIIEEINLLNTIAFSLDGEKLLYSNAKLLSSTITNYTRSRSNMGDNIVIPLNTSTPKSEIDELGKKIASYLENHTHEWKPEHNLVTEFQDKDTMKATLRFAHTISFHDLREREARKSKLCLEIKRILDDLKMVPSTSTT